MVIELWEQATPWVAKDGTGKERRNKAEQDETTHGSCHGREGSVEHGFVSLSLGTKVYTNDATAARLFFAQASYG